MSSLRYRADIDGLRAFAILAVLVFHLDPLRLPGGFVGVDIFFVISGYLITASILKGQAQQRFHLWDFFKRRFWRLYPALLATVLATCVAAYWLLPPDALVRFGRSVVSSVAAFSNVQFWLESGYFDTDAQSKALLHTWSLSVEWQFYLFWSLVLALWWRLKQPPLAVWIALLFALSLAGSLWLLAQGQASAAFFLSPVRVFEFMLGAGLVLLPARYRQPKPWLADLIVVVSCGLMLYAVMSFTALQPFPGWWALLPTLGAMGVLYAGDQSRVADVLRWRPVVALGLISYSVYLVHWPLIVMARYYWLAPFNHWQMIGLGLTSLALGAFLYRYVEQPFRYAKNTTTTVPWLRRWGWQCSVVVLLGVGAAAANSQGWLWRLPPELRAGMSDLMAQRAQYWTDAFAQKQGFSSDKARVYVIGNSFAADVYYALQQNPDLEVALDGTTSNLCYALSDSIPGYPAFDCWGNFMQLAQTENAKQADYIVVQELWSGLVPLEQYAQQLQIALNELRQINPQATFIITGPRALYQYNVPELLFKYGQLDGANAFLADYQSIDMNTLRQMETFLHDFAQNQQAQYMSLLDLLCEDDLCAALDESGRPLYWDGGHFSWAGAEHIHKKMQENGGYQLFQ